MNPIQDTRRSRSNNPMNSSFVIPASTIIAISVPLLISSCLGMGTTFSPLDMKMWLPLCRTTVYPPLPRALTTSRHDRTGSLLDSYFHHLFLCFRLAKQFSPYIEVAFNGLLYVPDCFFLGFSFRGYGKLQAFGYISTLFRSLKNGRKLSKARVHLRRFSEATPISL